MTILMLGSADNQAVDLGLWARHVRQHGAWSTVDFRNPVTGLFLAARAGTEDAASESTLTLTFAPIQQCDAETVIVQRTGQAAVRAEEHSVRLTVRVDDAPGVPLRARLVIPPADVFRYVQWLDGLPWDSLKNHRTLAVALPRSGVARYSLDGFDDALRTAQETCRAFLAQ